MEALQASALPLGYATFGFACALMLIVVLISCTLFVADVSLCERGALCLPAITADGIACSRALSLSDQAALLNQCIQTSTGCRAGNA